jgi:ATP-dependent DNA helicase RecG
MDPNELEALFRDIGSDRVERKPSLADARRIQRAICAFANDLPGHQKPGVVFLGVNDDGTCAGLAITDEVLKRMADMRDDGQILTRPSMTVTRTRVAGCDVAVAIVEPALAPPIRLEGRVWVRVGPTTREASEQEERRLVERRRAADLPFDLTPVPTATQSDLDLDLFVREYLPAAISMEALQANNRSVESQMTALRFLALNGTPTVLGILVLGKDPSGFLPGAVVRFVRVTGTRLTDPIISQKTMSGPAATQLRVLDEVVRSNLSEAAVIEGAPQEDRRPDYPLEAIRQLAHNAVAHRNYAGTNAPIRFTWYADRIEIQSPGGPYGQVTRERFGTEGLVDYRNPHLSEALRVLGFVQKFGIGIPLAKRRLLENGNPPIEFEVESDAVPCTIRRHP